MSDTPTNLQGVLDRLDESTRACDAVSIGDALDAFGHRLFGPAITVGGLLVASPLGAIPGVPAVLGVTIALIAGQHVLGFDRPWLPRRITRRRVGRERLGGAIDRVRPWARRVDRVIKPRLHVLLDEPMPRVIAGLCVVLALSLLPVGLIPFAAFGPSAAIAAFGLALVARDGVLAAIGYALMAASGVAIYFLWPWQQSSG